MALRPLDEWIADLRAHRDVLAAELKRVDEALAALGAGPQLFADPAPLSMIDMIISLFQENPNETFDAVEINAFLEQNGVPRDDAKDPVNSVRGALSRLKQRGVIRNVRRGVFQLNIPSSNEPDETSQTTRRLGTAEEFDTAGAVTRPTSEPWSTPQAKSDPWASTGGDQPPF